MTSNASQSTKRVRWASTAMAYDAPVIPKTPSPTKSDNSLPESNGPFTPPSLQYHIFLPETTQISIHSFLSYQSQTSSPYLVYDVSSRPEYASLSTTRLLHLLPAERAQPATTPGMTQMEIQIPNLPCWRPIQLVAHDSRIGVTIGEVIDAIYLYMRMPVTKGEFEYFPKAAQHKISVAFERRCDQVKGSTEIRSAERQKGLRRVDCLAGHIQFRGLTQTGKSSHSYQLQLSPLHKWPFFMTPPTSLSLTHDCIHIPYLIPLFWRTI